MVGNSGPLKNLIVRHGRLAAYVVPCVENTSAGADNNAGYQVPPREAPGEEYFGFCHPSREENPFDVFGFSLTHFPWKALSKEEPEASPCG